MSFSQFIIICALIICVVATIRCYVGTTTNRANPYRTQSCTSARYCLKKSRKSGANTIRQYSCDSWRECTRTGCSTKNKATRCCCKRNLCNHTFDT
ncbi:unnamed protein product [Cylicocyclus nassatus]|uniref:Uncharacterized protein n=1 Tax=Cylicocyclus nassatus TaxID=53992 RepID=A0AA36GTY2_CYLNA|nr:unnamed protein product [Cylicocyclus nassatus]